MPMNEKIYQSEQSKVVIEFVKEQYGGELEFLWQKFPTNAIWRNKQNKKWYGAMLRIPRNRLGQNSDEIVDILDLRFDRHTAMDFAASRDDIYPGYHMNKYNWITIILDESVKTEEIFGLIEKSYEITEKLK